MDIQACNKWMTNKRKRYCWKHHYYNFEIVGVIQLCTIYGFFISRKSSLDEGEDMDLIKFIIAAPFERMQLLYKRGVLDRMWNVSYVLIFILIKSKRLNKSIDVFSVVHR